MVVKAYPNPVHELGEAMCAAEVYRAGLDQRLSRGVPRSASGQAQ